MSDFLFIGGPWDGIRQHVPDDRPYVRMMSLDILADTRSAREYAYRMERMRTDKEDFNFYILDTMTISEAMAALLDGYRKPKV